MNKFMIAALCGILCTPVFAEDDEADSGKEELKKMAQNESVQEDLQEDGVSIAFADDGSYKALARGTGTYEWDDPDDRKDAKEEAIFEAKAALAHFLNETLADEKGLEKASKKAKTFTKSGDVSTTAASKEMATSQLRSMHNSAQQILTGVVTLESRKIPGNGDGGEIQVTIGVSQATMEAAKAISNAMTDSLNDRKKVVGDGSNIGEGAATGNGGGQAAGSAAGEGSGPAGAPVKKIGPNPNNKPEVRKNKTIF